MLLNGKEALYAERLMTGARPEEDLREGAASAVEDGGGGRGAGMGRGGCAWFTQSISYSSSTHRDTFFTRIIDYLYGKAYIN